MSIQHSGLVSCILGGRTEEKGKNEREKKKKKKKKDLSGRIFIQHLTLWELALGGLDNLLNEGFYFETVN